LATSSCWKLPWSGVSSGHHCHSFLLEERKEEWPRETWRAEIRFTHLPAVRGLTWLSLDGVYLLLAHPCSALPVGWRCPSSRGESGFLGALASFDLPPSPLTVPPRRVTGTAFICHQKFMFLSPWPYKCDLIWVAVTWMAHLPCFVL
jgi:hypothetical protein